jgi:hypothetical protein
MITGEPVSLLRHEQYEPARRPSHFSPPAPKGDNQRLGSLQCVADVFARISTVENFIFNEDFVRVSERDGNLSS